MTTTTVGRSSTSQDPPQTRGNFAIRWIEANCVLGNGDHYGEPFTLRPWQKAIIRKIYELRSDGHRRYRRVLIGMPKGNGKTPLVAAIAAFELAGGEHVSPDVPVSAASFEQADLAFGDLKIMFRESPSLAGVATVLDNEIVLRGTPGRAYRVAAARGSNDGARPTCYIADELHEFDDPAKEGAHLVLSNGTMKRAESLQLNVTTAGADLDSLLGAMYLHGKRVQAGEVADDRFLFIWFEGPDDVDITDGDALRSAIRSCNPAADDFLDVEEIAQRAKIIPEFEFRRYYLNQWTRASESWLPPGAWLACEGDNTIPRGADVFVGVDMAIFHDSAAVAIAWLRPDDQIAVQAHIWTPQDGRIDHRGVKQHIRELARERGLTVRRIDADPRYFELIGAELLDEGFPVFDVPQTPERMYQMCANAYELIVSGRLIHGGEASLTDHVLSAAQRQSDRGWTLSKGKSKRKIDGCIALVMAAWEATRPAEPLKTAGTLHYFN